MAAWMRFATSSRLVVRRSSSSAWSFFRPSAETYWGFSRLFTNGLQKKELKAWRPSAPVRVSMLRGQVYTDAALRRSLPRGLLRWFAVAGRDLPWRRTRDPYAILVSEVMLQQTQVSRVLPVYASFLGRFPTLRSLARASLGDVLRAWSGLGYTRRARDLHRVARLMPSRLPADVDGLDALPGIGA